MTTSWRGLDPEIEVYTDPKKAATDFYNNIEDNLNEIKKYNKEGYYEENIEITIDENSDLLSIDSEYYRLLWSKQEFDNSITVVVYDIEKQEVLDLGQY